MTPASEIVPGTQGEVTQLLHRLNQGETDAAGELIALVRPELHRIASYYMRGERENHTLQPTALMNEACLRLLAPEPVAFNNRNHFLAIASRVMRQVLVDYARSRAAVKRGINPLQVDLPSLHEAATVDPVTPELLDIDNALNELAVIMPRPAQLVELRFFGGLSTEEAAAVLDTSLRTAERDWLFARAWLKRRLA